jgi:hypothetical protein
MSYTTAIRKRAMTVVRTFLPLVKGMLRAPPASASPAASLPAGRAGSDD